MRIDWSIIDEVPKNRKDYARLSRIKHWRLNNLYLIKDKFGKRVKFRMNRAQRRFYETRHNRNIILKARQLGFTTFIQVDMLDDCIYVKDTSAGVIAHKLDDAKVFFNDKVKFAYNNLPSHIRKVVPLDGDSADTLRFMNGSKIYVSTSHRSGTVHYLHVSEFGKLAVKSPERAKEVKTGAFPAVPTSGRIEIESTAEGKSGLFYDMCKTAQDKALTGEPLTALDFKFHFFPWYEDPHYSLPDDIEIAPRIDLYLNELCVEMDIELTHGQRVWYQKTEEIQGDEMRREYPSTPKEAFEQSIEGAIFKKQMAQIRLNKQICRIAIDPSLPIHTFWDLGRDMVSIWFFQRAGMEHRFIDYHQESMQDIPHFIGVLKNKESGGVPYVYGDVYLPHDGTRKSVIDKHQSPASLLYAAGYTVRMVPRTPEKTQAIAHARLALPLCYFDAVRCADGIDGLDGYRWEWDVNAGVWKKTPLHNKASHVADAFMVYGDGYCHEEGIDEYEAETDHGRGAGNATTGY